MKKLAVLLALVMVFSLSFAAVAEEVEPGALLAYFTFDDAENLGKDASANGNDLVKAVNPDNIKAVEDGVSGGAVYFAGGAGLVAEDTENNDFMDTYAGRSFTISYYARVDIENAGTGNARVIDQGINGSDEGFVSLVNKAEDEEGNVKLINISKVGGTDWWASAGEVIEDVGGWHHYVFIYDAEANLLTTFIDGNKIQEVYADEEEVIPSAFSFTVGGSWAQWDWFNGGNHDVTAEGFVGSVDEVKVIAGAVYDLEAIAAAK